MTAIKAHINTGCFLIMFLTFVAPLFTFAQEPLGGGKRKCAAPEIRGI